MEMGTDPVRLADAADAYRDSAEMRALAGADPRAFLDAHGIADVVDGNPRTKDMDVRIHANTADVFHLPMPADPNAELVDEQLDAVAGGLKAYTAASAGTFACSTIPSTASTMSSASCRNGP